MHKQEASQQQKIFALFIFVPAVMAFSKGIGGLDNGLGLLNSIMIIFGLAGAILAGYIFFKAN